MTTATTTAFEPTESCAQRLDAADPMAAYRDRFHLPVDCIALQLMIGLYGGHRRTDVTKSDARQMPGLAECRGIHDVPRQLRRTASR